MGWDVAVYEAFANWRERPFDDLVARIPPIKPAFVVDAGCGTGRTTHKLASKYPTAQVLGVDSSEQMLRVAKPHPRIGFQAADLLAFRPPPADLVVANAVLHWIPDPREVLGQLASWVAPGGVLAIQVPANFDRPSHQIVRSMASEAPWSAHLGAVQPGDHILSLAAYRGELGRLGFHVDAWDTDYAMDLPGPEPVLNWLTGTTLRPYLLALPKGETVAFRAELGRRLAEAYPSQGETTRLPFRRRFAVAKAA